MATWNHWSMTSVSPYKTRVPRWLTFASDAVDNHYGGMGGGHYTATCKNMQDNKWYKFDDSHVSPAAGESDIKVSLACDTLQNHTQFAAPLQSSAAYLLFYRRRTSRPIGGVTKQKIDVSVSFLMQPAYDERSSADDGPRRKSRTGHK